MCNIMHKHSSITKPYIQFLKISLPENSFHVIISEIKIFFGLQEAMEAYAAMCIEILQHTALASWVSYELIVHLGKYHIL